MAPPNSLKCEVRRSLWKQGLFSPFAPVQDLFYTGTTRAMRMLLMIGSPSALKRAVETTVSDKRYTDLNAHMKSVFADCDVPSLFKAS